MNFFKSLKRLAFGAAMCLAGAPAAFAETSQNAIDVTDATDYLDNMKTALTTYWTAAKPVLIYVLGVALVVMLFYVVYKFFTKASKKIG